MLYKLNNDSLDVTIESLGAELRSIRKKNDNAEYLWQGDPRHWNRRSPVLFPIVGTVKNNQYIFEGKTYTLGIHGFARDKQFELISKEENLILFQIEENVETLKIYPFRFNLKIEYRLDANRLKVEYRVLNTDKKRIWFSIGGHPGFNCPLEPGTVWSDYFLEFEKPEHLYRYVPVKGLIAGGEIVPLKQGRILPLSPYPFQDSTLIVKDPKSGRISLKSDRTKRSVIVEFPGFTYLALWNRSEQAPYVCIEPWMGTADPVDSNQEFTTKEGLLSLDPGKTFSCSYDIMIQ